MLYLNDEPVEVTKFPDNTSQVWKLHGFPLTAWIRWEFSHEGEFMHLAQLKQLLDEHGVKTYLRISYLPYGRQDKRISNESTFALYTFADLLNSLMFDRVIITDPHSDVACELINRSQAQYPKDRVKEVYDDVRADFVCYPDDGALFKYVNLYMLPHISGEKVREPLTGKITEYRLLGDNPKGKNVLIVDDICDGGATFILLADMLKKAGVINTYLFVSHGIFSKGVRCLFDAGISRIFTKDEEITPRYQSRFQ